jgi:hypothetical protein
MDLATDFPPPAPEPPSGFPYPEPPIEEPPAGDDPDVPIGEPEDSPAEGPPSREPGDTPSKGPRRREPPPPDPDQEFPGRAPVIQDPPFDAPWPGAPIQEPDRLAGGGAEFGDNRPILTADPRNRW